MLVSAVSASTCKNIYFTNSNNKSGESKADISKVTKSVSEKRPLTFNCKVFEDITEWKNFCHKQILAGNLDVIV